MKAARDWGHLALVVVLALGVAAVVQAIADRHAVRFDLTPRQVFRLADVTTRVLADLEGPVEAVGFHERGRRGTLAGLLDRYQAAKSDFNVRLLDLDRNPGEAAALDVDHYGKVALRYRSRSVVVDGTREGAVTAGLLYLVRGRSTRVVFTSGHGERPLGDPASRRAYGLARGTLLEAHLAVASVRLHETGALPEGTEVVVLAGPSNDFLPSEIEIIEAFLRAGGRGVVLIDPEPLPNLERMLARFGVNASLDFIADHSNQLVGLESLIIRIPTFRGPVAAGTSIPALLPLARSIDVGRDGSNNLVFAESYPSAWAVRDFDRARDPNTSFSEGSDRAGPIPVGVLATWSVPGADAGGRLAVVGDADFASNGFLEALWNRDLLLSLVSWAAGTGEVLTMRPAADVRATQPLSPLFLGAAEGRLLFVVLCLVEPGLVLALGLVIGLRNRWRG